MRLIEEIEIAYFRSFYKISLNKCKDLNFIFGKNDAGKSNIVRALNLFFNNSPDRENAYDFKIDFSDRRLRESLESEGIRKFIYVKLTFNTPRNYQKSLGKNFYVKRQWTVSRGDEFVEEVSSNIKPSQRHIVKRFLNQIRFIYIPAIKDSSIFEFLLGNIYDSLSSSNDFVQSIESFTKSVQDSTKDLFAQLPSDIAVATKIAAPSRMDELFETLDFETTVGEGDVTPRSLTLQRGDGIKVRHIPELLSFIAKKDRFQYHVWGFEEPENSLDFVAAEAEAKRFQRISSEEPTQIFVTTHSPSFYNLKGDNIERFYVTRDSEGDAEVLQGRTLQTFDISKAMGEGFYLPAVAKALEELSEHQEKLKRYEAQIQDVTNALNELQKPVLLTEGKTDETILNEAWKRLRPEGQCPFNIKSCDTIGPVSKGGAGGVDKLAISLKSVRADNPHLVLGLFDREGAGVKAWELDRNFKVLDLASDVKVSSNGKAFGILLPVPIYRKENARHCNLPIEFVFPDEYLRVSFDGHHLVMKPMTFTRKIGDVSHKFSLDGGIEIMEIDESSKMSFANKVVPALPNEAFEGFRGLFQIVEGIIKSNAL